LSYSRLFQSVLLQFFNFKAYFLKKDRLLLRSLGEGGPRQP